MSELSTTHLLKPLFEKNVKDFAVSIDEKGVFKLLGYGADSPEPDQRVRRLVAQLKQRLDTLVETQACIALYRIQGVDVHNYRLIISNSLAFSGKNVVKTFRHAEYLFVGLCTIGFGVEQEVSKLFAKDEYAEAVILDALGSEAAEGAAVFADHIIREEAKARGWHTTPRLSPGYGSFDVTQQHNLFTMLRENQCGVTLSSSAIMSPRKSVSFIIGVGEKVPQYATLNPCRVCDDAQCPTRDLHALRCLR